MSEFECHISNSQINHTEIKKHKKIWKDIIEKYLNQKIKSKEELAKCTEYGSDIFDKTKIAAIEWAEDILLHNSEEDAITIFNWELSELDDEY